MSTDIASVVNAAVTGLGFELVDFERAGGGMMRIFIDKPDGISVENCADVSNHLTRLFLVENIDYSRLEVSSPGLDRPVKTIEDFKRFAGVAIKVRLNTAVENRKRFDGVVEQVVGEAITFKLIADPSQLGAGAGVKVVGKAKTAKKSNAKRKVGADQADGAEASNAAPVAEIGAINKNLPEEKRITVLLADIDRARLIPDV